MVTYAAMSKAYDELLVTIMKDEKYELGRLEDNGKIIYTSSSAHCIIYADLLCLGDEPGQIQVFAYQLVDFAFGNALQNRGKVVRASSGSILRPPPDSSATHSLSGWQ